MLLRETQKALQKLPVSVSGTDLRKSFLSNVSWYVTQKAFYQDWTCFLGHIGKYFVGDLLLLKNRVTHDVSCVMTHNGGLKQTYECYQCFHDVKSALYTVISNYHKARFLLKVINSKLNLIHGSIRKRTRNRQKSVFTDNFWSVILFLSP